MTRASATTDRARRPHQAPKTLAALTVVAAFAAPTALAQEQTGVITATCQVLGQPAQMQMQYTRYRDAAVWTDRHGLNAQTTDMQQWGTAYWEA